MALISLHNEKELLQQIAAGDELAFEQLYRHYRNKAYTVALTYMTSPQEAEDVLQECFLKLWKKRESLAAIEQFDHYLFIILRNMLVSALRKSEVQEKIKNHVRQAAFLQPASFSEAELAEAGELHKTIQQVIAGLPEKQQRIYRMSREAGMSHEEIAQSLEISQRTVSNTISLVLNRLRDSLREQGYLPETIIAAVIIFS